ncbi:carboxymuconolactone decarboxylase family protein [Streptomyces geranii]|uniref:carboxymuconolactone decarboxylase family protein n=1 Tax=Streptomyces geranii TaxID=2058923 RepID=UPI0018E4E426|nr:carboxymuconolactone decarboxylase family protein [Streptomyces geranii]
MARLPGTEGSGEIADRIRARRGGALRPLDHMLLHSPQLADGWNSLLGAIRQRIALPADIRELVVMRIAVLNRAPYEWAAHEGPAREAGMGDAELAALREEKPALGDVRRARVIAYTDAMTRDVHVPDELFDALRADFGDAELVELTATVAAYNMVSRFLVALDVRASDGTNAPSGGGS